VAQKNRNFSLGFKKRHSFYTFLSAVDAQKQFGGVLIVLEVILEVIRIYRGLVEEDATRSESQFAFYLDETALVTLGVCYERVPRFGGGAYHPILRRLETFTDEPLRADLKDHEKRATMVLDLEEKVAAAEAERTWSRQHIPTLVRGSAHQPAALD
jgi:hypothetical protein